MATITANTGSNNWNTNAAWVGSVQPTAADDVVIPASAIVTIPTATTVLGRSLTVQASGTLAFASTTAELDLGDGTAGAGSVAISISATATITLTGIGTILLKSTSATVQTITSNGKTLPNITVNGVGSSYQLADASTVGAAATVTLTAGTLDTNGKACSWGKFDGNNSNTRTLTLGASTITLTATSGTVWNFTTVTGLTFTCGTSTIKQTTGNTTYQLGTGLTYFTLDITVTTITVQGSATFTNVICNPAAATGAFILIGGNWTVTGTLTLTCSDTGATCAQGWLTNAANPSPTLARTITAAAVSLSNFDFSDIIAAGASIPWTGTNLGDGNGNSNITFPASRTLFWVGAATGWTSATRWATSTGGTTGSTHMPMAHDDVVFDANSAMTNASVSPGRVCGRNINMSACNSIFTWNQGLSPATLFGSFTAKAGMTISGTGQIGFNGRGTHTLTTNGVAFAPSGNPSFRISAYGGSYTLQDNLTVTAATGFQVDGGTFDANGFSVTTPIFNSSASGTRSIVMGSGTWTLNGTGTVFNMATTTNLTFSGASATVLVTDASATDKTIEHRQATNKIGTLTITGGGAGTVFFGPSGYYGTLTLGAVKTYHLNTAGTGLIVDTLVSQGSAGNLVTIDSATAGVAAPGTAAPIKKTNGVVSVDYISIRDSTASGGAQWFAGVNSTNTSGNTGWMFQVPVLSGFFF